MGIDMSRAFDRIKRTITTSKLLDQSCTEDEARIAFFAHLVLSKTKLRVKVSQVEALPDEFQMPP